MSKVLNINKFLPFTTVEGPGNRACIWVQGCDIQCPGCAVPWMWPLKDGKQCDILKLANEILKIHDIEGVTFSGGEPFLQASAIVNLCELIKEKSDLSILIFTGYELDFIISANKKEWNKLLSLTDILIDGPYQEDLKSHRSLTGSTNQKIHFLSPKYKNMEKELINEPKKIEIHISKENMIQINGNAEIPFLKELFPYMVLKKK